MNRRWHDPFIDDGGIYVVPIQMELKDGVWQRTEREKETTGYDYEFVFYDEVSSVDWDALRLGGVGKVSIDIESAGLRTGVVDGKPNVKLAVDTRPLELSEELLEQERLDRERGK